MRRSKQRFNPDQRTSDERREAKTVTALDAILIAIVDDLRDGNFDAIRSRMTPPLASLATRAFLQSLQKQIDPLGPVRFAELPDKTLNQIQSFQEFAIHMQHGDLRGAITVAADGKLSAQRFDGVKVVEQARGAEYITRGIVRLPFNGEWYAVSGGADPKLNRHGGGEPQSYAYDLVIMRDGTTHAGDGSDNQDYFAYGQPVLSPVDGTVVTVVDGIPDNIPGCTNIAYAPGNSVLIDDHNREWVFIAHLQPYRTLVLPGQPVLAGDLLGYCGSSGNSSEPHIHFHMQNGPYIQDASGLPITFASFRQNGVSRLAAIAGGRAYLENG